MRKICIILFIIYVALLVKLVVLKGPLFYQIVSGAQSYKAGTANGTYSGYNLVPFRTISAFLTFHPSTSTPAKVFNLLGNIALFIPMGILLPLLFKRANNWGKMILATFLISLCFELFQLVTHSGHFDVDDLLLNTAGGAIGYGCFLFARPFFVDTNFR